jgi:hypothetical protein
VIRIHITWPALLLLLIALLVWLARDPACDKPGSPKPAPARPPRRESAARRVPRHRQNTDDFVIDQVDPVTGDYAAETERLDREAADRGRQVHDETIRSYEDIKERMNARNAERRERNARR